MTDAPPRRAPFFFDPRRASGRLLLSVVFGVGCALCIPHRHPMFLRGLVFWDVSSIMLLALHWNVILRSTPEITRVRAAAEDPGRSMVWVIAVASSLFSLFAAVIVLRTAHRGGGGGGGGGPTEWTLLALAAVALSWLLTHTSYTLRYARLYYRASRNDGLSFPGTPKPCDVDFAYFAFGIAMAFQGGDVTVTCTRIRRTVLGHALIAFLLNTVIVALALNLVVGFLPS